MIDFGVKPIKTPVEQKEQDKSSKMAIPGVDEFLDDIEDEILEEYKRIAEFNKTPDRGVDSIRLGASLEEAHKLVITLRERLALCEMYRKRLK